MTLWAKLVRESVGQTGQCCLNIDGEELSQNTSMRHPELTLDHCINFINFRQATRELRASAQMATTAI